VRPESYLPNPPAPAPIEPPLTYPWVIGQQHLSDGLVRVTFALPGLKRAVVTVPLAEWSEGRHLEVGRLLAEQAARDQPTERPPVEG
jgi:hypothetical protein